MLAGKKYNENVSEVPEGFLGITSCSAFTLRYVTPKVYGSRYYSAHCFSFMSRVPVHITHRSRT